jgi:predicted lipoprotein with Yx(FWY)xxD motif
MRFSRSLIVAGPAAVLALAACGGSTPTTGATTGATAPTAAVAATVMSATVSGHGAVLVAGSNKMTLYQFTKDVANSGTRWPALTVPAGASPSASGLGGQWGTITRSDGGGIQVTYNGLPLYFFSGDSKPGDANGNYPGWTVVAATPGSGSGGGGTAPTATPTAAGGGGGYGY